MNPHCNDLFLVLRYKKEIDLYRMHAFLHQLSKTETHTASCQPSGEITENRAEDISAAAPCSNRKKEDPISSPPTAGPVPTAKEPTANRFLKALCEKDAVLDFYAASTCLAKAQTMRYVVTGPSSEGDYAFDSDKVEEYRKKTLAAPIKDGKAVLEDLIDQRKEEAGDDDMDWEKEILGDIEGGYDNCRFSSYWNNDTEMTYPLILAKIPVKNPWEIFAYLPFGGWNECPDTPELMAVAKYWARQYGAIPAAISHDELEFLLPTPVPEEKAMDTAVEQYGFCPDVVNQGPEEATVGTLADVLRQSTVWYFWWD